MTSDQMISAIRARPFRPFTMKTGGGREIVVTHPEAIAYGGGRTAVVVLPDNRFEVIDLLLVERIQSSLSDSARPGE
jgi:hypothetical protein